MLPRRSLLPVIVLLALAATAQGESPDFARDVRPILSDRCFACHGPDEGERQADLRFDTTEGLAAVVDQRNPNASELLLRIQSDDPDSVMPPPEFRKPLTKSQKETLSQWVLGGAAHGQHWAYVGPVRVRIKAASTPIDFFIDRGLARVGLHPNALADRRTLLRRVCFDLTGLPPSREQQQEFLADQSPDAYERLVDRLLESPHYGQHMGRYWLDLVRYADTHGLHLDNYREMWAYRDWVIDALNRNMPWDQFVTEQLAGDLLADATDDQKIASGFNRLNVTTNEGGSIYDEVFARNVIDRTDAFGTIFLGLTTGCAVCHDHKFDPISMRDYYSLAAYFNSLDGRALDDNAKDPTPVLKVPDDQQQQQLAELASSLEQIRAEMLGPIASVDQAQQAWEESLIDGSAPNQVVIAPTDVRSASAVASNIRDDQSIEMAGEAAPKDVITIVAPLPAGAAWQTLRLEALVDDPNDRVGMSTNGNVVLSEITVDTTDAASAGEWLPVPIVHAFADIEQSDGPFAVSYAIDGKVNDSDGWGVAGHHQTGPREAWFIMPPLAAEEADTQIRVKLHYQSKHSRHQFRRVRLSLTDSTPAVPEHQRITLGSVHSVGPFSIENPNSGYGRSFASQQREFKADEVFNHDDRPYRWESRDDLSAIEVSDLPIINDRPSVTLLHRSLKSPTAQHIKLLIGTDDGHLIYLNGKQIGTLRGPREIKPLAQEYDLPLRAGNNRLYIKVINHSGRSQISYAFRSPAIGAPERLVDLISVRRGERTDSDREALREYYRKVDCLHPDWLALVDQERGLSSEIEKLQASIPTTLIWKELDQPRQAHILIRGQYDRPGDPVDRGTPAFLPPMHADAPTDRLGLARWLVSPDHPLTARVAVNRFWQQVFGHGLVKTSEDFGSQGDPPSHPELLDYLAIDFRENGWDVKRLMKSLVMSQAYRRSSQGSSEISNVDPDNRMLARGPRFRLDAEMLRDQALALSGLLVDRQGGPSVKPPQPTGLWSAVGYTRSNTATFNADAGDKVYRRSVYIFWKRTSAPPQMSTFDAPSRESCTARRERTNTPLQALLLMNETQYLEAARHLAGRALSQPELSSDRERIDWLFETVTIRPPCEEESRELVDLLKDLSDGYRADAGAAAELVGDASAERAAWTVLASTLLNLDEVITK